MDGMLRNDKGNNGHEVKLGEQVETVRQDVKQLGRLAGLNAKRKALEIRERGGELVDSVRREGRGLLEQRPLVALSAAVGLGALAALLLSRR